MKCIPEVLQELISLGAAVLIHYEATQLVYQSRYNKTTIAAHVSVAPSTNGTKLSIRSHDVCENTWDAVPLACGQKRSNL